MATNFLSVSVVDYALATDPATKPRFLADLQNALINVGFLYLKNPPIAKEDMEKIVEYIPKLFDMPSAAKQNMKLANSPHFLGYTGLGTELTKGKVDQREQFEFGTEYVNTWKPGDPEYVKMWGPAQWPQEEDLPGFREFFTRFLEQLVGMSTKFLDLTAEALGLTTDDMRVFFDEASIQSRAKVIKYPSRPDETTSDQGIGPHFDTGFVTYLLQASPHVCLQAQNLSGQWIDVPPLENTFVVNIGKGLEAVTQGLARATSHRVLSPAIGSAPRYSLPFNHSISQHVRLGEHRLNFPPHILALKEARGELAESESVNHQTYSCEPSGQVYLTGRVKTFPECAKRHYPELYKKYFPNGVPAV